MRPLVGLSLMPEPEFLRATLPLFQNEQVEVLEWSFDTVLNQDAVPEWLNGLLEEYSKAGRLIGHTVYYSLFDAKWNDRQDKWATMVKAELNRIKYQHLTEHFGFMSAKDAHSGFPIPMPLNDEMLELGRNRLNQLHQITELPIGLENLVFAFDRNDVIEQGKFLERLLEPFNGFIILDLHNLYCQSHNFDVPMNELIKSYPLDLVKEIHISGGSWSKAAGDKVRRDTHDNGVPEEVFDALNIALAQCPHVEYVILERLGHSFKSDEDAIQHRADFERMAKIVQNSKDVFSKKNWGNATIAAKPPLQSGEIHQLQTTISHIFMESSSLEEAKRSLSSIDYTKEWSDKMILTALDLNEKWN